MPKLEKKPAKEPTLAEAMQRIKMLEHAVAELRADLTTLQTDVEAVDTKVAEKEYEGRGKGNQDDE